MSHAQKRNTHQNVQTEQLIRTLKNECMRQVNVATSRRNKMGKHWRKKFYDNRYSDPFPQPWANPKHAHAQVNGETQQSQSLMILHSEVSKRKI